MLNVWVRLHKLFENLRAEGPADALYHFEHHRFKLGRSTSQRVCLEVAPRDFSDHHVLQLLLLLGCSFIGVLEMACSHQLLPCKCPQQGQVKEFVDRFVEKYFVFKV